MTFFTIVAWLMLFSGTCMWLFIPGFLVTAILVGILSYGNPDKNKAGACVGALLGVTSYCLSVWYFLHHLEVTWLG